METKCSPQENVAVFEGDARSQREINKDKKGAFFVVVLACFVMVTVDLSVRLHYSLSLL